MWAGEVSPKVAAVSGSLSVLILGSVDVCDTLSGIKASRMRQREDSQALEYWCAHTGSLSCSTSLVCQDCATDVKSTVISCFTFVSCKKVWICFVGCVLLDIANTFYLLYYRSDLGDRLAYFPFIITRLPCKLDLCVSRFACVPSLLLKSVSKGSVVAGLRYMCNGVL